MTRRPSLRLVPLPFGTLAAVVLLVAGCTGAGAGTATPSSAATTPPSTAPSTSSAPGSAGAQGSAAPGASVDLSDCPKSQPAPLPAGQKRTLTIDTSKGPIVIEIDGALSPIAAGNIVALAECGWYDGVVFHRLVPGFVIQGGDGEFGRIGADGKLADSGKAGPGGPGYTIKDEQVTRQVRPWRGGDGPDGATPDSVGSQFFIVLDDQGGRRPSLVQHLPDRRQGDRGDGGRRRDRRHAERR